jgi:hypothetical protein
MSEMLTENNINYYNNNNNNKKQKILIQIDEMQHLQLIVPVGLMNQTGITIHRKNNNLNNLKNFGLNIK